MNFPTKDPVLTYQPPHYHGFCWSCCHPVSSCCCHIPTCRKEAKELLVIPEVAERDDAKMGSITHRVSFVESSGILRKASAPAQTATMRAAKSASPAAALATPIAHMLAAPEAKTSLGLGEESTILGGCCCVHLSIEYMPALGTATSAVIPPIVIVTVLDSEMTLLAWAKIIDPGSVYQIRENIITTKPGANLSVMVLNMSARIRWCEVFTG